MAPRTSGRVSLGIDLGGTKVLAGVVDGAGRIVGRGKLKTPFLEGADAIGEAVVAAAELALREAGLPSAEGRRDRARGPRGRRRGEGRPSPRGQPLDEELEDPRRPSRAVSRGPPPPRERRPARRARRGAARRRPRRGHDGRRLGRHRRRRSRHQGRKDPLGPQPQRGRDRHDAHRLSPREEGHGRRHAREHRGEGRDHGVAEEEDRGWPRRPVSRRRCRERTRG